MWSRNLELGHTQYSPKMPNMECHEETPKGQWKKAREDTESNNHVINK